MKKLLSLLLALTMVFALAAIGMPTAAAEEEFHILRMTAYGRIDMIYDGTDFWFIEANNLPGMTNTSLLPEAAAQTGITYEDLCERIAIAAGRRHA